MCLQEFFFCACPIGATRAAVEITAVTFAPLSEREIDAYVASGEPMDKAGAYAIQGLAGRFIPRIEGCYFNVVGLPLARLYALLRELGWRDKDYCLISLYGFHTRIDDSAQGICGAERLAAVLRRDLSIKKTASETPAPRNSHSQIVFGRN